MLTIKNGSGKDCHSTGELKRRRRRFGNPVFKLALVVSLAVVVGGCAPPGPRALLSGKRLLEQGRYPEAVEQLRLAVSLLATNAQAWNYLGLACHHTGQAVDAEKAYLRALALNHDLTEAHYNLGCLWLGQNKLEAARTELTTYTLRRSNSVEGLLRLGAVQLRLRELNAAEKSFRDALQFSPQNPEALNGLGLVRLGRGHASEAMQYFNSASKAQPDYGPALLNAAVVDHQYLRDYQLALEKYREYLALKPLPDNAEALAATVRDLEQEVNRAGRSAAAIAAAQLNTNNPRIAATNVMRTAGAPKPELPVSVPKPDQAAAGSPARNVEVVKLPAEPVFARYAYKSPGKPVPGNRADAQRAAAQGLQALQSHRLSEALQAYRLATRLDPGFFEAYYNYALISMEVGNLHAALTAYEYALAAQPDSLDARYNFALVLKQANYMMDAVNELERILTAYPNETRAHLALGNIYAQQLRRPAIARAHYMKVLEVEPRHPQADAIRYWLAANPR
jgi:Flp pilus assembly protein TadD